MGRVPMLAFELALTENTRDKHVDKQDELGKQYGAMMRQSSETWHDNAPAEAIRNDSMLLEAAAGRVLQTINRADIFDYTDNRDSVTLGSLVEVLYDGSDTSIRVLLTGVVRSIPEEFAGVDDVVCATIASPLGQSIFDKRQGDRVDYRVDNRMIGAKVMSIHTFPLLHEATTP